MCPTGETCIDGLCYEWTCDPDWYGTHDGCDCECGGVDPGTPFVLFCFLKIV